MSDHEPIVSVIIPTFRRADELKRAIDSCVKQTYSKIEIIVIKDDTSDDLESLQSSYPQVIWLTNEQNMGAPYSRNRGLAAAKGEYINFLDDDDELFPEKIERQVALFQLSSNQRLGVVTCDVEYIGPGKNVIMENRMHGDIYRAQLTKYCVYGIQSMLIKKDILEQTGGFDLKLQSNQEYDLSIRLSRVCEFENIHQILVRTNESKDQISYNFKKKLFGTLRLYRKYNRDFLRAGIRVFLYNQARFSYLIMLYTYSWVFGDRLYRRWSRI